MQYNHHIVVKTGFSFCQPTTQLDWQPASQLDWQPASQLNLLFIPPPHLDLITTFGEESSVKFNHSIWPDIVSKV